MDFDHLNNVWKTYKILLLFQGSKITRQLVKGQVSGMIKYLVQLYIILNGCWSHNPNKVGNWSGLVQLLLFYTKILTTYKLVDWRSHIYYELSSIYSMSSTYPSTNSFSLFVTCGKYMFTHFFINQWRKHLCVWALLACLKWLSLFFSTTGSFFASC